MNTIPKDPTSALPDVRQTGKELTSSFFDALRGNRRLDNVRIGVPEVRFPSVSLIHKPLRTLQEYFPEELDPSSLVTFKRLIQRMRAAGAQVSRVSLPGTRYALSAYYVIASAEASSNLARYSGVHYGMYFNSTKRLYPLRACRRHSRAPST